MSQRKQFFISYRSVNRPLVERLVQDIKALGHEVWFDKELTGGQAWWDQIMDQVRSCDYVIAALSPEVAKSKPCTEERNYARLLGKTILPVMISQNVIITHFEPELGQIQAIDYSDFDDKHAALALARAIDQLPAPVPLPVPTPLQPEVPASYLNTLREKVQKRDLSYQEQSAILSDLKRSIHDFDSPKDMIPLIEEFLNRPDISVQINKDTQSFLQTLQSQTPAYRAPTNQPTVDEFSFDESSFDQPVSYVAVSKPKNTDADKWSDGMYYGFFAVGFFLPIIGVGLGLYGMFVGNPLQSKKDQGRNVLILSIVMWFIWAAVFNEIANSMYYGYGY
jgi:hypothetical protein